MPVEDAVGAREELVLAALAIELKEQFLLARSLPIGAREGARGRRLACDVECIVNGLAHRCAPQDPGARIIAVLVAQLRPYGMPPMPVTSALSIRFTCRAPPAPINCRTASTRLTPPPASPGWPAEIWPPLVFSGRSPVWVKSCSLMKAQPWPALQKPSISIWIIIAMMKSS